MSVRPVIESAVVYCPYCKAQLYSCQIFCSRCGRSYDDDDVLHRTKCFECGKLFLHNTKYLETSRQKLRSARHAQSNSEQSSSQSTATTAVHTNYSESNIFCPRCLRRKVRGSSSSGCLAIVIMLLVICFSLFAVAHLV